MRPSQIDRTLVMNLGLTGNLGRRSDARNVSIYPLFCRHKKAVVDEIHDGFLLNYFRVGKLAGRLSLIPVV